MAQTMTQKERLDYLLKAFKDDSDAYRDLEIPSNVEDKKRLLRSLMNVRLPAPMSAETLEVQDAYLQQLARDKGIVSLDDIPVTRGPISIWQGDITRLAVDAIVNAANSQMLGCFIPLHSCIDNCIHSYAGVQLREECDLQMERLRAKHGARYEQPVAVPMLTDAYNLPARQIIHIVGPIVEHDLTPRLEEKLRDCYLQVLDLAHEAALRSVAFCCISTGVFRFPAGRASQIAVQAVTSWLENHPGHMERVIFNVFKDTDRRLYEQLLC